MIFLSVGTFLGGDVLSTPLPPTSIDDINYIEIKNAEFKDLYVTKDVVTDLKRPNYSVEDIPKEWDFDTLMHGDYETGEVYAGNINWTLGTITNILIKRKLSTDFKWTTLEMFPIETEEDLRKRFTFIDYTPTNGTWMYAAVPVLNMTEGTYITNDCEVQISKLVIIDKNEWHSTDFTDGGTNITCLENPGVFATMYNKYPTVIYNSDANYKTISFSSNWYADDDCNLESMEEGNDKMRIDYLNIILDFLTNRLTKLIKCPDGRRYMCQITTLPTVKSEEVYTILDVDFTATEVGNCEDEQALYTAGFISATEEWWNT